MKRVLKSVPVQVGNIVSWIMLALSAGFVVGWIMAYEHWLSACFPVV